MPKSSSTPTYGIYSVSERLPVSFIAARKSPAQINCSRYFCDAVRPSFRWFLNFVRSSTIPTAPLAVAISITIAIRSTPSTPFETRYAANGMNTMSAAAMNERPPIVGVPSFDLCQRGPTSSIFCPSFMLRSFGINNRAARAVTINAETNAVM